MPECQYILQISSCASEAIESFARITNCNIKFRNPDRALTKCSITFQCSPKVESNTTNFFSKVYLHVRVLFLTRASVLLFTLILLLKISIRIFGKTEKPVLSLQQNIRTFKEFFYRKRQFQILFFADFERNTFRKTVGVTIHCKQRWIRGGRHWNIKNFDFIRFIRFDLFCDLEKRWDKPLKIKLRNYILKNHLN